MSSPDIERRIKQYPRSVPASTIARKENLSEGYVQQIRRLIPPEKNELATLPRPKIMKIIGDTFAPYKSGDTLRYLTSAYSHYAAAIIVSWCNPNKTPVTEQALRYHTNRIQPGKRRNLSLERFVEEIIDRCDGLREKIGVPKHDK